MTKDEAETREIRVNTNLKVIGFTLRWCLIYFAAFGIVKVDLIGGLTQWIK